MNMQNTQKYVAQVIAFQEQREKNNQTFLQYAMNGVQTNIAKNEYQEATGSNPNVDSNYYCAQNPTMEGCEEIVRDPIVSTGGGHNSINLSNPGVRLASSGDTGDDFSAESSLGGSVTSNDKSEGFESETQGITAKFQPNKGAGAGGGSGAPGASANGGGPSQNDPRQNKIDRQAADEKKPLIAGKINARQSNKKKKGFGGSSFFPTSRNDDQKDALANSGNPFEGLFGNSNKSKKEVMRGLASDGVALKSDGPSVSIFRRITKVHRRKYQKNQLLKSL